MRLLALVIAVALTGAAIPSLAVAASNTGTVAGVVQQKPPLALTEAQRQRVAQAVSKEDALEKPPADFHPAIGAKVPTQKKLAAHPLPRPLVYEIPVLKQYYYARLPDQVLIIDPMTQKIVDIIAM